MNAFILLSAVVLATNPASGVLGLEDVLALALEGSESPEIARARVEQSEAALRRVWADLLPTVTLSGIYRRRAFEVAVTRDDDAGGTERSVLQANDALFAQARISSTLFDARTLSELDAARDESSVARAVLAESRFELAHQVADAYVAVRVAEGTLRAARQRLEVSRRDARSAAERQKAGLIANVERDRAALEAVEAEVLVARGEASVRTARLALGLLVGRTLEDELRPAEVDLPTRSERDLLLEARDVRPQIRSARATVEAAEARALAPWLDIIPTLSVDGVVNATNETGFLGRVFNWNVALTLEWTLYDGGERYAEARTASRELAIAQLQLSQLERTVDTEVRTALVRIDSARAETRLAARRVRVARQYAKDIRLRAERGLATAIEAADAAVSLYEAEVEAATIEAQLAQAVLRLRRSIGRWPNDRLDLLRVDSIE